MPLSSPPVVFLPPPAGKEVLVISGASTSGVNGRLIPAGTTAGKPAWSTDGSLTVGAANVIMKYNGTAWVLALSTTYSATKTSAAEDPVGLSTWTVGTGAGSPTVAAASAPTPPIVTA